MGILKFRVQDFSMDGIRFNATVICECAKCRLGISSGLMGNCGFLYGECQFYMIDQKEKEKKGEREKSKFKKDTHIYYFGRI